MDSNVDKETTKETVAGPQLVALLPRRDGESKNGDTRGGKGGMLLGEIETASLEVWSEGVKGLSENFLLSPRFTARVVFWETSGEGHGVENISRVEAALQLIRWEAAEERLKLEVLPSEGAELCGVEAHFSHPLQTASGSWELMIQGIHDKLGEIGEIGETGEMGEMGKNHKMGEMGKMGEMDALGQKETQRYQ